MPKLKKTKTYLDPLQAAMYWFLVAQGAEKEYRSVRELAQEMRMHTETIRTLLNNPNRLKPIRYELKKIKISLPKNIS